MTMTCAPTSRRSQPPLALQFRSRGSRRESAVAQLFSLGRFALMNILSFVALSLMLVVGALLFVSVFGLKICVQRFARSHDLHCAGFIQRPYWLLFFVSLVFVVPPFIFDCLRDDDGYAESLLNLLIGSFGGSGAIGLAVSLFWMAIAGFLSLFRQLKFKH